MNLEKEFSNYVKDFSKNFDYDIPKDYPVQTVKYIKENLDYKNVKIFNEFNFGSYFSNNDGTINYLISSKIQDLIYEKQKEISKNNELEK